jgi:heat shock protein HtpX
LIDDAQALVAALHKLERHHTVSLYASAATPEGNLGGFLRSHPETWERVGTLLSLAH